MFKNLRSAPGDELIKVTLSFLYFFCLMTAYFILRPVRDEMGIRSGVDNLQWLFTGTFAAMILVVPLFGWLTKKLDRQILLPAVYLIFLAQLILFFIAMHAGFNMTILAAAFYIWLSVFNLFVISLFWSFMSDIFSKEQSTLYFPTLAAGGTFGAIIGPSISAFFASYLGTENLLAIAAGFIGLTLLLVVVLIKKNEPNNASLPNPEDAASASIWEGILQMFRSTRLSGIGLFIVLYTCLSTFLYFEQAHIVSSEITTSDQRTTFFAMRDIGSNVLTLLFQFFITKRLIGRYGIVFGLTVIPILTAILFFALGASPGLYVIAAAQIIYRSGNHAIQRPSREMLFTEVSDRERYQGKNFVDTTIYRGGDALSGWGFTALTALGTGLSAIAFLAIPIALAWCYTGYFISNPGKLSFKLKYTN